MFIENAFAQTINTAGTTNQYMSFLWVVALIVFGYFFMIRPQIKAEKEFRTMLESIKKGDKVITSGGLIGEVVKIDEKNIISLKITPEVTVKVDRQYISAKL